MCDAAEFQVGLLNRALHTLLQSLPCGIDALDQRESPSGQPRCTPEKILLLLVE